MARFNQGAGHSDYKESNVLIRFNTGWLCQPTREQIRLPE